MIAVVLLFVVVVAAIWAIKEPFAGMLALLAVHMIQPGELYPALAPLHLEKILAAVVLGSFLLHGRRLRLPPVVKCCLWFYAAILASIPLSVWFSNAVTNALDFAKTILLLVLVASLVNTRKRFYWTLMVFVLVMGFFACSSITNYYSGHFSHAEGFDRIIGLTSNSDTTDSLALTMASALPLILLMAGEGASWRRRAVCLVIAAAAMWTMLFTGSRNAMLALLLTTAIFVITSRRRVLMGTALLAVGLSVWAVLPQQYKNRYAKQTNSQFLSQDAAYTGRVRIWKSGWRMFLDHPLTGVGIGDFNMADGTFYWKHHWMDAHNIVIKAIGELGIVGTIAFFAFVVVLVRSHWAMARAMDGVADIPPWQRNYPRAANFVVLLLLLAGYGDHDLYRDTWYFLAGFSAALWLLLADAGHAPTLKQAEPATLKASEPAREAVA